MSSLGEAPPHRAAKRRGVTTLTSDLSTGLSRAQLTSQLLAGATLFAIAIPEQLATSRLALVPAFSALIAFVAATVIFSLVGSNPIVSVGADSTIAPLFAVALTSLAAPFSTHYLELVSATAVVTGIIVMAVGLARLGWIADFLSLPILTGFMAGVGLIIVVHQLPDALGVSGGGESIVSRVNAVWREIPHAHVATLVLAGATLVVMSVGERLRPRLPWALVAIVGSTVLTSILSLSRDGVVVLGAVSAHIPQWRLGTMSLHEWGVVVTTSMTVAVVVLSQSAATTRNASDELAIAENVSRDFVGVGAANVVAGLLGTFPVDASPPRTSVVRLAGGRTRVAGLFAAALVLVLSPLAHFAHSIPLAALAGVLFFIAGRLIRLSRFRAIIRSSRLEFAMSMVSMLGVVVLGVERGLAVAVALALASQTWRSAHPHLIELGLRANTTSWEPLSEAGVHVHPGVVVVFFDKELFFANVAAFRRQVYAVMSTHHDCRGLVIDAVAISDIDYTAQVVLADMVAEQSRNRVRVVIARANEVVSNHLARSSDAHLAQVTRTDSVDAAVSAMSFGTE